MNNTHQLTLEFQNQLEKGNLEVIKDMTTSNPELLTTKNKFGLEPILIAIRHQHEDVVHYFLHNKKLSKFIDIHYRDSGNQTIFHYASYQNNINILEDVISTLKIDPIKESFPFHMNILSRALSDKNFTVVYHLFEKYDITSLLFKIDDFKENTFSYLFSNGNLELISHFFNIVDKNVILENKDKIIPFINKVGMNNNDGVIEFLLDLRINDELFIDDISSLFIEAILHNKEQQIQYLINGNISQKLNLNYKNEEGINALIACTYVKNLNLLQYLLTFKELNNDSEIYHMDKEGYNIFIAAVRNEDYDTISYLLDNFSFENNEKTLTQLSSFSKRYNTTNVFSAALSMLSNKKLTNHLEHKLLPNSKTSKTKI